MKKIIIFFAALAALLSCTKENPSNYNPVDGTYSVTLTASAPGADTKTTLVDGEGTKFVHWSKGDAIKVLFFPNHEVNKAVNGPSRVFNSSFSEQTSEQALFRCDDWTSGLGGDYMDNGVALYPSTAVATSSKATNPKVICNTVISFDLPKEQNAVENNIESNLNFSYALISQSKFLSSSGRLSFSNACAMIELTMPSDLTKKVTSITIQSNNNVALTGAGAARLSYYQNEIDSNSKDSVVDGLLKVDVANGDGVVLNNPEGFKAGTKYYAVIWPGIHNDGLTIKFMADDETAAVKTTPALTIEPSRVKPYTFNKGLDFVAAVQEFNYIYADGTTGNDVKSNIVGVVIYRGNPKEKFNDPDLPDQYCNGLAISAKNVMTSWGGSSAVSNQPQDAKVAISANDIPNTNGGYTIKNVWANNNFNLPIYNNASYADLSSCNTSGWYLGTKNEWSYIHSNLAEINTLLTAAGADAIQTVESESTTATSRNTIWLPFWCVSGTKSYYAVTGYFDVNGNLKFAYNYNYSYSRIARPIFAF